MESSSPNAVLRRKASAAKEVWQARAMSPSKALRLSLARTAEDLWDLALAASGIAQSEDPLETVIAALPDDGLITLLDGPEGAIGAAFFQFPVVSGLVEVQTIGKVSKLAPDPRRVTRTDAAMVAPLIDSTLERFDALMAETGGAPWAQGFRFGSMMESARLLSLALRATDFHVFRITLDLAAQREGEAMLIFPVIEDPLAGHAGQGTPAGHALEASVLQAPAELRAVLHRLTLPLSAVSALKPGDTVPIPRDALDQTVLEVGETSVKVRMRLGQMNGMRAVRLAMPGLAGAAAAGLPAPGGGAGDMSWPDPSSNAADPMPPSEDAPMSEPLAPLPSLDEDQDFAPPQVDPDDLLGDLPDLGGLPGLGGDDAADPMSGEFPDLGDLGSMPMAALPDLD
ncbi:MAG: FliM/FliN family flagellar motor C-terminal domain-containing protein [Pseudomonadota bacterium]|nr:FliM/FliN family flagellar motor C-terminal domain-containing protein [Pseudomonadota bacterium]